MEKCIKLPKRHKNILFNHNQNEHSIKRNRDHGCHWRRSGTFIVNFEHISHLVLVFLLLNLNM